MPSARMPASLRGPTIKSFGHLRSAASPVAACTPSRTATPAASVMRDRAGLSGVGVNVRPAAYPPDVAARAVSLEGELGRSIDRGLLLSEILIALWDRLAQRPGDILQAWRAASPNATGTRVEWGGKHGTTAGIDDSGALLVKTNAGIERIIAGELRWML